MHRNEPVRRGTRNENPPGIGFWALLREDLRTHENDLFCQGFWAIAVHRFGNWRMSLRRKPLRAPFSLLYKISYKLIQLTCGIELPYTVKLGRRIHIWHFGGLILSARSIGDDCHLRHSTTFGVVRRGAAEYSIPTIGDRVDIGAGAVIVGPITIGDDSVIGANAVVLESVPPRSTAVGNPARILDPGLRQRWTADVVSAGA